MNEEFEYVCQVANDDPRYSSELLYDSSSSVFAVYSAEKMVFGVNFENGDFVRVSNARAVELMLEALGRLSGVTLAKAKANGTAALIRIVSDASTINAFIANHSELDGLWVAAIMKAELENG